MTHVKTDIVLAPKSEAELTSGIFDLGANLEDAAIHLLPVPWEVTTSYGRGASRGPAAILRASRQVDLFDLEVGSAHEVGYFMSEISNDWLALNDRLKSSVGDRIPCGDKSPVASEIVALRDEINAASRRLNDWVEDHARTSLRRGQIVGVIGGDHSSPYGLIKALLEKHGRDFGILHIDAHADLRDGYQGFQHSHASIMRNVVEDIRPRKLVQVGLRDFCREEFDFIQAHRDTDEDRTQIKAFFDRSLKKRLLAGESFNEIAREIAAELPRLVYISFDIDGLEPSLCPHTGTPVPGGLSYDHVLALFEAIANAGHRIIGFDLNEVAETTPGQSEWDANVAARLLFKICGWTTITNGLKPRPEVSR